MNRRRFIQILTGSALSAVAAEAIPFNRVWSFPSKIQVFDPEVGPWVYEYSPYLQALGLKRQIELILEMDVARAKKRNLPLYASINGATMAKVLPFLSSRKI